MFICKKMKIKRVGVISFTEPTCHSCKASDRCWRSTLFEFQPGTRYRDGHASLFFSIPPRQCQGNKLSKNKLFLSNPLKITIQKYLVIRSCIKYSVEKALLNKLDLISVRSYMPLEWVESLRKNQWSLQKYLALGRSSEDFSLLEYCAMCSGRRLSLFQRCLLSPLFGGRAMIHRSDDGGSKHSWNFSKVLQDCTAQCPRRLPSLHSPPWECEISQNGSICRSTFVRTIM